MSTSHISVITERQNIWAEGIARRDEEVFTECFHTMRKPLLKFVRDILHNAHDAEEVATDTLTDVWTKIALFQKQKSCFASWMYTIAKNKTIDLLRKRNRIISGNIKFENMRETISQKTEAPDNECQVRDMFSGLLNSLQLLQIDRTTGCAIMLVVKGWTYEEIGKELHLTKQRVKGLLRYHRPSIASCLRAYR